jgi:hypothetical protein
VPAKVDDIRMSLVELAELIGEWTGYAAVTTPGWPKTLSRAPQSSCAELPLRMFGVSVTFERSYKAGESSLSHKRTEVHGASAHWIVVNGNDP